VRPRSLVTAEEGGTQPKRRQDDHGGAIPSSRMIFTAPDVFDAASIGRVSDAAHSPVTYYIPKSSWSTHNAHHLSFNPHPTTMASPPVNCLTSCAGLTVFVFSRIATVAAAALAISCGSRE
jgi:hypothetical protein